MKQPIDSAKRVGQATTGAIAKTAGRVTSALVGFGKDVFMPFSVKHGQPYRPMPAPGASPGIDHYLHGDLPDTPASFTVTDYGPDILETKTYDSVDDVFAAERPAGSTIRWLNIDGLNPRVVDRICKEAGIHPLAAEDVLNTTQRPKLEFFDDHFLVVVRQIRFAGDQLRNEQLSMFCFKNLLITFQEEAGDVFDPVRQRLEKPTARFRTNNADYLLYTLIDSIVDHLFPLLEGYGNALEELEQEIIDDPRPSTQRRLFAMKRDLSLQRRAIWPVREVVDGLYRDETTLIAESLKTFLRDVYDHAIQVIDLLEGYRETASSLSDLYQSSVGNKMNETMKVLTIMASFFIPITFIAGVYGMNFQHIPELDWRYSYFVFWGLCLTVSIGLGCYFWKKGWIGKDS